AAAQRVAVSELSRYRSSLPKASNTVRPGSVRYSSSARAATASRMASRSAGGSFRNSLAVQRFPVFVFSCAMAGSLALFLQQRVSGDRRRALRDQVAAVEQEISWRLLRPGEGLGDAPLLDVHGHNPRLLPPPPPS